MKRFILLGSVVLALAVAGFLGLYAPEAYGTACGIDNIQKSFDPIACEVTIQWTTTASTDTNLVWWGTSGCANPSYPNMVGATSGTTHVAVIDVTEVGPKINFKIHSSSSSCSEETGCNTSVSGPCAIE